MLCSTGPLTLKIHTGEEFRWPLKIYKQAGLESTTLKCETLNIVVLSTVLQFFIFSSVFFKEFFAI